MILDLTPNEAEAMRKAANVRKIQIAPNANLYDKGLTQWYKRYSDEHKLLIEILAKLNKKG
jgi:hypothetical protein